MANDCRRLFFAFGCFLVLHTAATVHGETFHIAIRNDEVVGTGTEADPYDGSSPERLHKILEQVPDGACLRFGPGTFSVGMGLTVASGKSVSLIGSGKTMTSLKLQDTLPSGDSPAHPTVGMVVSAWGANAGSTGYSEKSSLYVADLTLDANVEGSLKSVNFTADVLHTNYPTVVVERVKVVNCGGSENYPTESFHMMAWYTHPDNEPTRTWTWYQRFSDIHVVVRPGQTRTATVLSVGSSVGQPPAVPAIGYTIVENCIFDAAASQAHTYVASIGAPNGAIFRNNLMVLHDKVTAMNIDTWDHRGVTIEGNKFFLYDETSGVRLGSGPNLGTFRNDLIRENQFFVASNQIGFCIQLNGVSHASITGNQFLSLDGAHGSLAAVDLNNTYFPHKNELIEIRDNLLDTALFQFPLAKIRGDPKEDVVSISEGNRSVDGTQRDGKSNSLLAEHEGEEDVHLHCASAELQVLTPRLKNQRVRLPRITPWMDGRDSVQPGHRFTLINRGGMGVFVSGGRATKPISPGTTVEFLATSSGWIEIARVGSPL